MSPWQDINSFKNIYNQIFVIHGTDFTRRKVKIRRFDNSTLSLSDIQVASKIVHQKQESSFCKNGRLVIQNPTRIFGPTNDTIGIYYEIYNLSHTQKAQNSFYVSYELRDDQDELIDFLEHENVKPGSSAAVCFNISIESLRSGDYELEVNTKDMDNNDQVSKTAEFTIWRSPLAMKYNDFDEALEKLSYIAGPGEIKKIARGIC